MPSQKKIDIVEKLSEKVSRAKAMVFTNYQGLTHKQLEQLKKALKTVDAELVVTKNTLLSLSLEISNVKSSAKGGSASGGQMSNLSGPTATLFSYSDIIAPLKELAKIIKLLKLPTVKFAIIDGKTVGADDVLRLSTLPSREVLLAQLVMTMKAPIYGLHRTLSWNLQNLVMTLKAVEYQKSK